MDTDLDSSYTFSSLSEPFDRANMCFIWKYVLYMESVNCFGKKSVQDGKCIFASSKLSGFSVITNFLTLIDILLGFIDQFAGRKRECWTFRPGNYYYLILLDILFFNILSWILLLNGCLETRSLHIIAKLDGRITFVSFWKYFLTPLSWLSLYGIFVIYAYYMFLWYKSTFHRYGHIEGFWCNSEEKSIEQFLYKQKSFDFFQKNGNLFYIILKSYPSLLKSPKFVF